MPVKTLGREMIGRLSATQDAAQKARVEMFVIVDGVKHPWADVSFQIGDMIYTGVEMAALTLKLSLTSGFWGAMIGSIGGYLLGRRKR